MPVITRSQILKTPFLQDILNSCHEVTVIGLEPPHNKFGEKISTILGVSPPRSLDTKGIPADVQVVL